MERNLIEMKKAVGHKDTLGEDKGDDGQWNSG